MAAARYWRLIAWRARGALTLAQLELHDAAGRIDAQASVTSSVPPAVGTLAALGDSDPATSCTWSAADVRVASFAVYWDFGSATTVSRVVAVGTLQSAIVQYYDGAAWRTQYNHVPGGSSASDDVDVAIGSVTGLWPLAGSLADVGMYGNNLQAFPGQSVAWVPSTGGVNSIVPAFSSSSSPVRAMGSGVGAFAADFTIECWVFLRNGGHGDSYSRVAETNMSFRPGGWCLVSNESRNPGVLRLHTSPVVTLVESGPIPNEQWTFLEISRAAGLIRMFVDGQIVSSTTFSEAFTARDFSIGSNLEGGERLFGSVAQMRLTDGVARHVASYTPPTAPFPTWAEPAAPTGMVVRGAQMAASSAVVPHGIHRERLLIARDTEFGGRGRIWGDTAIKGTPDVPTRSRVVLLRQRDKLLARETWSDPQTGQFEFTGVDPRQEFLVLVEDAAGNYRPVAASRLVPEAA